MPKKASKRSDRQYIHVSLPRAVHKRLRIHAIETDEDMQKVVERYIREGMERDGVRDVASAA